MAGIDAANFATEGLLSLAKLDDKEFKTVADAAFVAALTRGPPDEKQQQRELAIAAPSQSTVGMKSAFAALSAVILEASKFNSATPEIQQLLEDASIPEERAKYVLDKLEKARPSVRAVLSDTSFHFTAVVDVSWRMDYYIKSNLLEKVKIPIYFITLKTRRPDGSIEDIEFTCNFQELQDLLAKVKDAVSQVETLTAATK